MLRAPADEGRCVKLAVLGATGTTGRALVPHLALRHDEVPVSRRPPRVANGVPVLTPRPSSWGPQLVTPVRAGVARPLVEGFRNPIVAQDDDELRALVPLELTPFDDPPRSALAPRTGSA
jgi:hypothetical protein